jgi:predicted porin
MKKIVATAAIAASSLGLAGGAHAQGKVTTQSNVAIYGLLDAAVDYNTNVDAAGHSRVWMPSLGGGMFPSRLGFRGAEDLGGGLKAIFTLEAGIYMDTGASGQGNRLFGRQAWVGLAGNWGQVTLGRNYNMLYNSMPEVEIIGPTQYGLGSIEPAIPNGRADNSIAYKGSFERLTVGAAYSLGRDTSSAGGPGGTNCPGESGADHQACREWSAMLRYDAPNWGLTSAYVRMHGGPNAAAGLNRSDRTDSRLHAAGYTKFGAWRLATGALIRNKEGSLTQPRSNLYYIDGAYKLTPAITVDGLASRLDYRDSINDTKLFMLRAIYDFSKRTSTYAALGHVGNKGTAAIALSAGGSVGVGMAQNGFITGIKHAF